MDWSMVAIRLALVLTCAGASSLVNLADWAEDLYCLNSTCTLASQYCLEPSAACTFCFAVGSSTRGYCVASFDNECFIEDVVSCGVKRAGTCTGQYVCAGSTPDGSVCEVPVCASPPL